MTNVSETVKSSKERHLKTLVVRRDKSGKLIATVKAGWIRGSSVLSSRGQVVIPSEVREVLDADQGDRVLFEAVDEHTMIVRIDKKPTADTLFGYLQAEVRPEMRDRDWDEILQIAKKNKAKDFQTKGFE